MRSIEDVAQRLREVEDRLATFPSDAFDARITLRVEERELRGQLRTLGTEQFGADEAEMVRARVASDEASE